MSDEFPPTKKRKCLVNDLSTPFAALHDAAEIGPRETLEALLASGANVNLTDILGRTPLICASRSGRLDTVKILIDYGARVNQADEYGDAPLYLASLNGHVEVVQYLLQHGAYVDQETRYNDTPLYAAAQNGHYEIVQVLLQNSADPDLAHVNGDTPICVALQNGHLEVAKALLGKNTGAIPLYLASQHGHLDIVKGLVRNGASINQSAHYYGHTALYMASRGGHSEVVRFLLENGANPNQESRNDGSPLFTASKNGHLAVVRILLEHGANPNLGNTNEATSLSVAASEGYWDILLLLLKSNAQIHKAFKIILEKPESVVGWLGNGGGEQRTILSLRELPRRDQDKETSAMLKNWDYLVALLWFHLFGSGTPGRFPPLLEDTRTLSDADFKKQYNWMVHSVSSLLFLDNELLQHLIHIFDADAVQEVCEQIGTTPLMLALDLFPRWVRNEKATAGVDLLVEWNPAALRIRDPRDHDRIPVACALARSLPVSTVEKMVAGWPASILKRDRATGLFVFLISAVQSKDYGVSDIYSISRGVMPDKIAAAVLL